MNKYYGFQNGGDRKSEPKLSELKNENDIHTQKQLADSYGITKQTMSNYMRMANMIPEIIKHKYRRRIFIMKQVDNHNQQTCQSNKAKTELYSSFLEDMDYFNLFGFLLSRFAYELIHEKQMSD